MGKKYTNGFIEKLTNIYSDVGNEWIKKNELVLNYGMQSGLALGGSIALAIGSGKKAFKTPGDIDFFTDNQDAYFDFICNMMSYLFSRENTQYELKFNHETKFNLENVSDHCRLVVPFWKKVCIMVLKTPITTYYVNGMKIQRYDDVVAAAKAVTLIDGKKRVVDENGIYDPNDITITNTPITTEGIIDYNAYIQRIHIPQNIFTEETRVQPGGDNRRYNGLAVPTPGQNLPFPEELQVTPAVARTRPARVTPEPQQPAIAGYNPLYTGTPEVRRTFPELVTRWETTLQYADQVAQTIDPATDGALEGGLYDRVVAEGQHIIRATEVEGFGRGWNDLPENTDMGTATPEVRDRINNARIQHVMEETDEINRVNNEQLDAIAGLLTINNRG